MTGTLRVHFTAEDLGRIRLAPEVDHLWEVVLSLHLMQTRDHALTFTPWRQAVGNALQRTNGRPAFSALVSLDPVASFFPDFLTPRTATGSLEEGLEALQSTSPSALIHELNLLGEAHLLPPWTQQLATGDQDAMGYLVRAVRTYHDAALEPFQGVIRHGVDQFRRSVMARGMTTGSEGILQSLGPTFAWSYPILSAPFVDDFDMYLEGRGITLIPSFFCMDTPVKLYDPALSPTIVIPIPHDPRWVLASTHRPGGGGEALDLLLGDSRARILEFIASRSDATTGGISQKLHISPPTVSYHIKILRDAGLLESGRDRYAVIHQVTQLGHALLHGAFI